MFLLAFFILIILAISFILYDYILRPLSICLWYKVKYGDKVAIRFYPFNGLWHYLEKNKNDLD